MSKDNTLTGSTSCFFNFQSDKSRVLKKMVPRKQDQVFPVPLG